MKVSDYLDESTICFLKASSREAAILELVEILHASGKIQEEQPFYQALLQREKILSTGIGRGVAIPHAKGKEYPQFFLALGIQQGEGIEWNALDKAPVRLIFLIGGPKDKQDEYLQILSKVTFAIKDDLLRKKLLSSKNLTKSQVAELIEPY